MNAPTLYQQLASQSPSWERFSSGWDQVILSSRIRLARNLQGFPFPERLDVGMLEQVAERILTGADRYVVAFRGGLAGKVKDLEPMERDLLLERRIISPVLGQGGPGRAYAAGLSQRASILVNEEDHVRIQTIMPGGNLRRPWLVARAVEAGLREGMDFAFNPTMGYLTACPSNVGTGLRASVMLHLPGLVLSALIEPVIKGLNSLGYAVRGTFGEGSEGTADCYQVSNQSSLGETEADIINQLSRRITEVVNHEQAARRWLVKHERCRLYDHVGRAYGILRYARVLTTQEALNGISALATGVRTGILRNLPMEALNRLFLWVQPGHLQGIVGKALTSHERDEWRAHVVRDALGGSGPTPES